MRYVAIVLSVLVGSTLAGAQETLITDTPIAVQEEAGVGYRLNEFSFRLDPPLITVEFVETKQNGKCAKSYGVCKTIRHSWDGRKAVNLFNSLTTANLTSNSLVKRLTTKAVNDGALPAGSVSGGAELATPTAAPGEDVTPVP